MLVFLWVVFVFIFYFFCLGLAVCWKRSGSRSSVEMWNSVTSASVSDSGRSHGPSGLVAKPRLPHHLLVLLQRKKKKPSFYRFPKENICLQLLLIRALKSGLSDKPNKVPSAPVCSARLLLHCLILTSFSLIRLCCLPKMRRRSNSPGG